VALEDEGVKPIFSEGPLERMYLPIAMFVTARRKFEQDGVGVESTTVVDVAIVDARRVDVDVVFTNAV
jgi:hypothetical protein